MALLPKGLWFSLLKGKLAEPTLWVWLCYCCKGPLVLVFLLLLRSLWFSLRSNSSRKREYKGLALLLLLLQQQEKGIQRVGSATAAAPAAGKLAEPTKGLAGEYKAAQQENGKTNGWLCNNF
jgi:hypothetical protein